MPGTRCVARGIFPRSLVGKQRRSSVGDSIPMERCPMRRHLRHLLNTLLRDPSGPHSVVPRLVSSVLALLLVAGCGDERVPATATRIAVTATGPPTVTVAPTQRAARPPAGATVPRPAAATFANPVLRTDFPDPDLIQAGNTYYAFATGGSGHNIQAATSADLVTWRLLSDALPGLPRWADFSSGNTWAPEVITVGGKYLLYYTTLYKAQNKHCIGVATAAA